MDPLNQPPTVVGVHTGRTHGFSKRPQMSVRLLAGIGVEGDAHAGPTDQHRYHVRRFGRQPNLRQVHLLPNELLDELAMAGIPVRPGELGENITTAGIELLQLPSGSRLHIGTSAVVELTGLRNPCVQIERFRPGLLERLVERTAAGIVRKAGVMGIVVAGGDVHPHDAIRVELPAPPHEPLAYRVPGPGVDGWFNPRSTT